MQLHDLTQREIVQASLLAKHGHYVYLVPEVGSGKHYDAIVDGVPTEFKEVTGGISAMGKRFNAGMKQGYDVFLKIDSALTIDDIYRKLKGEIVFNVYTTGKVYIYISGLVEPRRRKRCRYVLTAEQR